MLRIYSDAKPLRSQHPNNRGQGRKAPKRPERAEGERLWDRNCLFTHLCVSHRCTSSKVCTWALRARLLGYFVASPRNRERSSGGLGYIVASPRYNAEPNAEPNAEALPRYELDSGGYGIVTGLYSVLEGSDIRSLHVLHISQVRDM